jgi:hypothetical protein
MSTVSIFSPLPTRLLPDLNIWVTLRVSYKKQEMLILCEDMFFFGGVRVPIYSLFVLCLGPNVAGSVCPSIHFSLCVLGPMLPDLCAHLFTFRSVSWAQCCRVRVPIYLLFVLCLGPNVAGSVCPSIHFSFCVLGPMLPVSLHCPFLISPTFILWKTIIIVI